MAAGKVGESVLWRRVRVGNVVLGAGRGQEMCRVIRVVLEALDEVDGILSSQIRVLAGCERRNGMSSTLQTARKALLCRQFIPTNPGVSMLRPLPCSTGVRKGSKVRRQKRGAGCKGS